MIIYYVHIDMVQLTVNTSVNRFIHINEDSKIFIIQEKT